MNDLDRKTHSRDRWCSLANFILTIGFAIALGLNACSLMYDDRSVDSFNSKKWQNSHREEQLRLRMLNDLSRKFNFKGQTSDEAIKVLGKPDLQENNDIRNSAQEHRHFCYWLQNRGMRDTVIEDYLTFRVNKSGKIIDYFITTRSFDAGMYSASKEYRDSVDRILCGEAEK